jgi:hypothetical protein
MSDPGDGTAHFSDYVHPSLRQGGNVGDQEQHVAGATPEGGEAVMKEGDDPGDFTVAQVNAYLDGLGEDDKREVGRVLRAEKKGQARKGIVGDDA